MSEQDRESGEEAKQFLRYLLACSTHKEEFDLKAHVQRIKAILGLKEEDWPNQLKRKEQ